MTQLFSATLSDLIIPNGTNVSRLVQCNYEISDAEAITIVSPNTLPETVNIYVSLDGTNYFILNDTTNTAIVLPAGGAAITYNGVFTAYKFLRLQSTTNVGADRDFKWMKTFRA